MKQNLSIRKEGQFTMSVKAVHIDTQAHIMMNASICSCTACESMLCFSKRALSRNQCTCANCENSKTCLFSESAKKEFNSIPVDTHAKYKEQRLDEALPLINRNEDVFDIPNLEQISGNYKIQDGPFILLEPSVQVEDSKKTEEIKNEGKDSKKEIRIPNQSYNEPETESAIKKSGRYSYKIEECKLDSVGGNKKIKKEVLYEWDNNKTTATRQQSKYTSKMEPKKKIIFSAGIANKNDKPKAVVKNMEILSGTANNRSAAELSAQVMNLPFKDFTESISYTRTNNIIKRTSAAELSAQVMNIPMNDLKYSIPHDFTPAKTKLSPYDVFRKIREAFDACSCKVCECIASISFPTHSETCRCKPCSCNNCNKLTAKANYKENYHLQQDTKKHKSNCDCKSCECIQCIQDRPNEAICDCKPCECIACKYLAHDKARTIIVAPVSEENQRRYCTCTPCACFECVQVYGTIATNNNITHEMSTGVSRHPTCCCESCPNEACEQEGAERCQCETHDKVMRKPVQRDTHDYDIRNVTNDNYFAHTYSKPDVEGKNTRGDTLLYATLSTTYSRSVESINDCSCNECECLICKCKEEIASAVKSPHESLKKVPKLPNILNACKCSTCECQICNHQETNEAVQSGLSEPGNVCKCDVCDCIHCVKLTRSSFNTNEKVTLKPIIKIRGICKCKPCECIDCQKMMSKCIGKDYPDDPRVVRVRDEKSKLVQPSDKGELVRLTRSKESFASKDNSRKYSLNKLIMPYRDPSAADSSGQDLFIYHTFSQHTNGLKTSSIKNLKTMPIGGFIFTHGNEKILNCSDKSKNKTKCDNNCKETECQVQGSDISAASFNATTSRVSTDESRGISDFFTGTLTSECPRKGSCNSSGYDNSNYLIRFPKIVEACIRDVMQLDKHFDSSDILQRTKYENNCVSTNSSSKFKYSKQLIKKKIKFLPHGQILRPNMCKNWNATKACECNPCDCDKCKYKIMRFQRCTCMCHTCYCCGTCQSEDQQIYIRKNEFTQTSRKILQDQAQDNGVVNNVKVKKYWNCKDKNLLNAQSINFKSNEISKDQDSLSIQQKSLACKLECNKLSDRSRTIKYCINDNFDQCSNVSINSLNTYLHHARAFSQDLLRILEKYQKANREFQSISQRLKESHESVLSGIVNYQNDGIVSQLLQQDAEKEYDIIYTIETNENQKNEVVLTGDEFILEQGSDNNIVNQERHIQIKSSEETDLQPRESEFKNLNFSLHREDSIINSEELTLSTAKDPDSINYNHEKNTEIDNANQDKVKLEQPVRTICYEIEELNDAPENKQGSHQSEAEKTQKQDPIKNIVSSLIEDVIRKTYLIVSLKNPEIKHRYKKYRKLIKRAIYVARRYKLVNALKNEFPSKHSTTNTKAIVESKQISDHPTLKQLKDSDERYKELLKRINRLDAQFVNSNIIPAITVNNERTDEHPEENKVDMKKPIDQFVRTQFHQDIISHMEKKMGIYNQAKLQVEVKSLLNMLLLQVSMSSCERLKVSFERVSRVSNHTILVKWQAPRLRGDIQGYELLVDGRPVKKVLSPSRCMAVVTCLPHSDKVLLTIRTITYLLPNSAYYPSTTIVYRLNRLR